MANAPRITDAEWEVMKVLWERAPQTANEIVIALDERKWSPATVRTLITRLVQKGALRFEKSGREYSYLPCVTREEGIRQERRSFMRRVYDGAAQPLLAGILEEEELSIEDLETLRRMLNEKRRGLR
jgi:BlaI family transcriptional regulator, penicillinase repressor